MTQDILMRFQVPAVDGATDGFSNSFLFESATATDYTGVGALANFALQFYNSVPAGGVNAIAHYLYQNLDRGTNHAIWNAYDVTGHLDGTSHGGIVATGNWTLGAEAVIAGVPEGVCACLSWKSSYGTADEFGPSGAIPTPPDIIADYGAAATHTGRTRPRARDRNRVFIGPLNYDALTDDATTKRTKLASQFITDCTQALVALATGEGGYVLRVWSRRDAATKLPVEGWMDDRPDYQRRRSDPTPGTKVFVVVS